MTLLDYEIPERNSGGLLGVVRIVVIVIFYLIASLPCGLLVGIYGCFFSAAIYLGEFPSYGNPEPRALPSWMMFADRLLAPPSMALVPLFAWFVTWCLRRRWPALSLIVPIVLALGSWVLLISDPFGAVNWWFD